jgi:hypothetical protein
MSDFSKIEMSQFLLLGACSKLHFKEPIMAAIRMITMSMREIDRLKTVQAVADGNLKPGLAAQRLALTLRQVQRLVRRYFGQTL